MLRQLFQFDQSHLHAFEREIAARSNRLGAAYASLASLAYAVVYWLIGPLEFVPVNVVGGLLLAAIALRPPANPGPGIFLVVNLALVVLASQVAVSAIHLTTPYIFPALPLQVGRRSTTQLLT